MSVADGWSPVASHYKEITLNAGETKELYLFSVMLKILMSRNLMLTAQ